MQLYAGALNWVNWMSPKQCPVATVALLCNINVCVCVCVCACMRACVHMCNDYIKFKCKIHSAQGNMNL
jgi:hypothetical protein